MSIFFLSPYQSQYRSRNSIRFTQRVIEGKNFEFSDITNFFASPMGVQDSGCPLYNYFV